MLLLARCERRIALGLLAAATLLAVRTVRAESTLRVARRPETAATAGGVALLGLSQLAGDALTPKRCNWCEPPGFDLDAQRSLRWSSTRDAAVLSNGAVALEPLLAIGELWLANPHGGWGMRYDDALLVAQSVTATMLVTDIVKLAIARERPRVHCLSGRERALRASDSEDNLSFYSGHTAFAFSLACSAGTVASLRGYRGAPFIWGSGLGLAAGVGYLRIAADAHYATDVLIGALVGSAVGITVPLLHRAQTSTSTSTSTSAAPLSAARGLSISGVF